MRRQRTRHPARESWVAVELVVPAEAGRTRRASVTAYSCHVPVTLIVITRHPRRHLTQYRELAATAAVGRAPEPFRPASPESPATAVTMVE